MKFYTRCNSYFIIFILLRISLSKGNYFRRTTEDNDLLDKYGSRPKMFTFYSRASKPNSKLPYENDMILLAWKAAWHENGWDPIVLSLDDAKKHHLYKKFEDTFHDAEPQISLYDRYCFYRWLAVAAHGGGWMSDFDNFPLNIGPIIGHILPNDGQFTSYDGHVPDLLSGSLKEWNRMIDLLYDSFMKNSHRFWSDMLALREIHHENEDAFLYLSETTTPRRVFQTEFETDGGIENPYDLSSKCIQLIGIKSIHFSHADCDRIRFCNYKRHMAYEWVRKWEEKCIKS